MVAEGLPSELDTQVAARQLIAEREPTKRPIGTAPISLHPLSLRLGTNFSTLEPFNQVLAHSIA